MEPRDSRRHSLWYTRPASQWLEGLPIGTGRLAAMVMGGFRRERLALNHEWLWSGIHRGRDTEPVPAARLSEVRRLLRTGRYIEGGALANALFGGSGGTSGRPGRVDAYQPAGDLHLELSHGAVGDDYRRELDLDQGLVTVSYTARWASSTVKGRETRITREAVAHLGEDLLLLRIHAGGKPFSGTVWLDRVFDPECDPPEVRAKEDRLSLHGQTAGGIAFEIAAALHARGGRFRTLPNARTAFEDVEELLIAVNIGTSACDGDPHGEACVRRLSCDEWPDLVQSHRAEHRRHFGGMELVLDGIDEPDLPTDERLRRLRSGESDPGLVRLYFDFGRYLLCASSARAALPAHLQGKWNEDLYPPWNSDYHHNINLQMNYWVAEPAGLQAYVEALLRHMERFVPHARKAARDLYGCEGILFPLQTDAWGRATPESHGYAVWIGAAPWLAQHAWWHYDYSRDVAFLRERGYPFLREVAAFLCSYAQSDEDGVVQFIPSQSPENRFEGGSAPVSLGVSAALDVQLARDALTHAVEASEILGVDEDRRAQWADLLRRLPPPRIGSRGQLLEWNEDFPEAEPGHRHLSHLFGVFPGEQFTAEDTPELFAAARRSLDLRMAARGGHTGWSRAWAACLYARFGEGELAFEHLVRLAADYSTDTLLDLHPPRVFQIDGNLGGAAAVLEMLLHSGPDGIRLLPALPSAWPSGRATGLRARGGFRVDLEWRAGARVRADIHATVAGPCSLFGAGSAARIRDDRDTAVPCAHRNGWLTFDAEPGRTYTLECPSPATREKPE